MHDLVKTAAKQAYETVAPLEKRRALYRFTSPIHTVDGAVEVLLDLQGAERVLDVGCGSGAFILKLAESKPGLSLTGVDLSAAMFAEAERRASAADLSVTFREADIAALPFPDRTFDRVTALHMLYHVPEIDLAVGELSRVVKKGGRVLVSANSRRSKPVLRTVLDAIKPLLEPNVFADTINRFNVEDGTSILRQHFQDVQLHLYESTISLISIDPYMDYFDSMRGLWIPSPSDAMWQAAMGKARDVFSQHFVGGVLQDVNVFGVLVLQGVS